jgi:UDP-N-acetyl-D-galactosamine dehydrogenase
MMLLPIQNSQIAILGLGYVGLPLAVEFAKKYPTIGFDIDKDRVQALLQGHDHTLEVSDEELQKVLFPEKSDTQQPIGLKITSELLDIKHCNIFIVTVPTPTDKYNRPVLMRMLKASESIGKILKSGDVVIYESSVYPGVT